MAIQFKKISVASIKQKILSNKKHSIIFGIVFVLILIILFQNIEVLDSITVGKDDITYEIQNIKKLQMKLKLEQRKVIEIKELKKSLIQKGNEFWITQRDGQADVNIQKKIESAAKQSDIELKTLGTLRSTSIGNGISSSEFDISCSGKMESIIKFIYKVSKDRPKIYWERCLLRPDNIKNPKKIYLTGYLKFIILENEDIISLLLENNAK